MYDAKNGSGFVFEAMKYRKRAVLQENQAIGDAVANAPSASNAADDTDECVRQELENSLGSFILPRDIEKLKEYLGQCVELRKSMLWQYISADKEFPRLFNFYLTNPELVCLVHNVLEQKQYHSITNIVDRFYSISNCFSRTSTMVHLSMNGTQSRHYHLKNIKSIYMATLMMNASTEIQIFTTFCRI